MATPLGARLSAEHRARISQGMKLAYAEGRDKPQPNCGDRLKAWRESERCRQLLSVIGRKHGPGNARAHQALPRDLAAARCRLRGYQRSARLSGLLWDLTFELFSDLITRPCWYCGAEPSQTITKFKDQPHNGIDRVDNNKGYTRDNVVAACGECNKAKRHLSKERFLELARNIAERHPRDADASTERDIRTD
jgi:hypothetical protein